MKLHAAILILTILTTLNGLSFGQASQEIDSLLSVLAKAQNSNEISTKHAANEIINYGKNVLLLLADRFDDNTSTEVNSDCQNFKLTKGEIAMILADRIEYMPYAKLTNIQNCLMTFCEDNPNLIEYYFYAIRRDNVKKFQVRYKDWLKSGERKKWPPYLNNKKKKTK